MNTLGYGRVNWLAQSSEKARDPRIVSTQPQAGSCGHSHLKSPSRGRAATTWGEGYAKAWKVAAQLARLA